MFITGVSPILLDDLSSGFNIVTHISQHPALNAAAGFTRADVERAVSEFLAEHPEIAGLPLLADPAALIDVLERHYDGYRFYAGAPQRIWNSEMVLYFLKELAALKRYPDDMLDLNARTDYQHLVRIGALTGTGAAARRALLEAILSEGHIDATLIKQFGAASLSSENQFISLLYFMGMLTFGSEPPRTAPHRLEIPNRVVRELQWEYLAVMLKEQESVSLDTRHLEATLRIMAVDGDIAPFLDLFHSGVVKALGIKDLRQLSEKALKLMLMTYISLSRVYHPLSEREFAQGYCDLFLAVSQDIPAARFAWLLEVKYLPTNAKASQIDAAFAQARRQVERYASDTALVSLLSAGKELKAGSLVFIGAKKVLFRPWPAPAPRPASAAPRPAPRPGGKRRLGPAKGTSRAKPR
jgi:hypothetical protein